jgi:hypothetical protein
VNGVLLSAAWGTDKFMQSRHINMAPIQICWAILMVVFTRLCAIQEFTKLDEKCDEDHV